MIRDVTYCSVRPDGSIGCVSTTKRCMKCNHIIKKEDRYCKYCGARNIYKPLNKILYKNKK